MSGGSYDYVCHRISEIELRDRQTDPRRATFQVLLHLVGDAMHAIEWVDSCDWGPGDEHGAIDKVFAFLGSDPDTITKAHAYEELSGLVAKFLRVNG